MDNKTEQTMRAARWHDQHDVRVEEVPLPTPRADQVLIEVEWCGICGTDLEEYRDGPVNIPLQEHPLTGQKAPITLGHEIVGKVVEPARDGSGPPERTRVIPDVVLGCGECWWCQRHQEGLCANVERSSGCTLTAVSPGTLPPRPQPVCPYPRTSTLTSQLWRNPLR